MFALRLATGTRIAPFGDPVGDVLVGNTPLARLQEEACRAAGLEVRDVTAESPPADGPHLVFTDRCWFTPRLLRRFAADPTPGRLRLDAADWTRDLGPFQPDPARPELAMRPGGAPPGLEGPDRPFDAGFHPLAMNDPHPAFAHAVRGPMAVSAHMAQSVLHWSDLLRVNLLSLAARAEEAREDWETGGLWKRVELVAGVLGRAKGLSRRRIALGLGHVGKRVKIHETAIVEACEIGDDVEIGPYSIVRGCVLGDRVKVDPYCTLGLAIVGEGARIGRMAMVNVSVVYPGAFVSEGGGWQMCVIGRDAFLAKTSAALDLSFGGTIRVRQDGASVDTGSFFLGSCIGHRAKLGAFVRLAYGSEVPNDVLLVAPAEHLFRKLPEDAAGTWTMRDGAVAPVPERKA